TRHPLQNRVITRLDWKLQLAAHDNTRSHDLEQLWLQVLRMGCQKAKAPQSRDGLDLAHERGEAAPALWVSVVVDVLTKQDDLSRPCCHGLAALVHDRCHRHMLLPASHAGHDAERAVVVAPLDDTDEVTDAGPPRMRQRLTLRVVIPSLEAGDEGLVVADGYDGVEMWKPPAQAIAFFGDDAPGDCDGARLCLPFLQLMELGVDAVLWCLAHDARVEDRDVSPVERVLDVARGKEPPGEALGIRRVHLASDRPDVERPGLDCRQRLS